MLDKFIYRFFAGIDFLANKIRNCILCGIRLEAFSKAKEKENKQMNLFRNLKEVETGANGTQNYI